MLRLRTRLLRHQEQGVRECITREDQYGGGFLWYAPGLGKTLHIIALALAKRRECWKVCRPMPAELRRLRRRARRARQRLFVRADERNDDNDDDGDDDGDHDDNDDDNDDDDDDDDDEENASDDDGATNLQVLLREARAEAACRTVDRVFVPSGVIDEVDEELVGGDDSGDGDGDDDGDDDGGPSSIYAGEYELHSRATLVVCPKSSLGTWRKEVWKHVKGGPFVVTIGDGAQDVDFDMLAHADFVLVTFGVVLSAFRRVHGAAEDLGRTHWTERHRSPFAASVPYDTRSQHALAPVVPLETAATCRDTTLLFAMRFERAVIDESHNVRTLNSKRFRACVRLSARFRWCLTGSPLHNEPVEETYCALRLVHVPRLMAFREWTESIKESKCGKGKRQHEGDGDDDDDDDRRRGRRRRRRLEEEKRRFQAHGESNAHKYGGRAATAAAAATAIGDATGVATLVHGTGLPNVADCGGGNGGGFGGGGGGNGIECDDDGDDDDKDDDRVLREPSAHTGDATARDGATGNRGGGGAAVGNESRAATFARRALKAMALICKTEDVHADDDPRLRALMPHGFPECEATVLTSNFLHAAERAFYKRCADRLNRTTVRMVTVAVGGARCRPIGDNESGGSKGDGDGDDTEHVVLSSSIMRLRQAAIAAALVFRRRFPLEDDDDSDDGHDTAHCREEDEETSSSSTVVVSRRHTPWAFEGSTKMTMFRQYVDETCRRHGHKVVVFSHFRGALDLCERVLRDVGVHYVRVDGSVSANVRHEYIARFAREPDVRVFLVIVKAMGESVDGLQAACNRVLFVDPWFNPEVEQQAMRRVLRMGQRQRKVFVTHLVINNTFEERMVQIASLKGNMLEQVCEGNLATAAAATGGDRRWTAHNVRDRLLYDDDGFVLDGSVGTSSIGIVDGGGGGGGGGGSSNVGSSNTVRPDIGGRDDDDDDDEDASAATTRAGDDAASAVSHRSMNAEDSSLSLARNDDDDDDDEDDDASDCNRMKRHRRRRLIGSENGDGHKQGDVSDNRKDDDDDDDDDDACEAADEDVSPTVEPAFETWCTQHLSHNMSVACATLGDRPIVFASALQRLDDELHAAAVFSSADANLVRAELFYAKRAMAWRQPPPRSSLRLHCVSRTALHGVVASERALAATQRRDTRRAACVEYLHATLLKQQWPDGSWTRAETTFPPFAAFCTLYPEYARACAAGWIDGWLCERESPADVSFVVLYDASRWLTAPAPSAAVAAPASSRAHTHCCETSP